MPTSDGKCRGLLLRFESNNERRSSKPRNGVILPFKAAVGVFLPYGPIAVRTTFSARTRLAQDKAEFGGLLAQVSDFTFTLLTLIGLGSHIVVGDLML